MSNTNDTAMMTLETANYLRTAANEVRFSDMTAAELSEVRAELAETLDIMETSGAACSPLSGFETVSAFFRIVCGMIA